MKDQISAAVNLAAFQESIRRTHDGLTRTMRELRESLERYDRSMLLVVDSARALGQSGWTIPLLWAAHALPEVIPALAADPDLDALFTEHYADPDAEEALLREVRRMEELVPWSPLLNECVESFEARRYLIVVPSLFVVFEGAMAAATESWSLRASIPRSAATRMAASARGLERAIWGSLEGFAAALFGYHHFSSPPPTRINRHWVLHGRTSSTATRLDCLRLFQAIHTAGSQVPKTFVSSSSPAA